jgi:hypothetical protein
MERKVWHILETGPLSTMEFDINIIGKPGKVK